MTEVGGAGAARIHIPGEGVKQPQEKRVSLSLPEKEITITALAPKAPPETRQDKVADASDHLMQLPLAPLASSKASITVLMPHPTPLSPEEEGQLADAHERSETIDTMDVATPFFLEQRIGEDILDLADRLASHDEKEKEKVSKELFASLDLYPTFPEETKTIDNFVRKSLGLENFQIRAFTEAGSGASVYGIFVPGKMSKSQLAYVAKILPERLRDFGHAEFARELSSLRKLTNLALHHSSCPRAERVGRLSSGDTSRTMFIQTAANGSQFSDLLKEIGKLPTGAESGAERLEALAKLHAGFRALANGLAELHLKNKPQEAAPIAEEITRTQLEWFKEGCDGMRKLSEKGEIPLTPEEIDRLMQLEAKVEHNWGAAGYAHGDAHLDNLFYESLVGQFSFIDTVSFLKSVTDSGRPQGMPEGDIAWTLISLLEKGMRAGLSKNEVLQLQDEFIAVYDQKMGGARGAKAGADIAVAEKYIHAIEIAHLDLEKKKSLSVEERARLRGIIDFACEKLKKLL